MRLLHESKFQKKRKVPTLVRIINKGDNSFNQRFKYGANLRFMRDQNLKRDAIARGDGKGKRVDKIQQMLEENQVSNFLILKSDIAHIQGLKEESDQIVTSDMKDFIRAGAELKKKSTELLAK